MRAALLLFCVCLLPGQKPEPAVYTYSGKPVELTHPCGTKEIEDLGLVCTEEEPCPLFLEIAGVEAVASKIFLAGNFHTGAATLASVLLVSEDEGRTWREAHPRLPGALLDQIQFVDFQTGFVSGNVAGSLARDPFFLKTEDGGKTWRRLNVFDEGGYGVVGSFRFTSPAQGTLVIEGPRGRARYRRMETMTGGESWMTKEVMDALPPAAKPAKGAPPPQPAPASPWRLRGENATRSLRLERRDGPKWVTVTQFSLPAGACKPDPARDIPPEPEPPAEPPKPVGKP
jgi:hypothetical protein